MQANKCVHGRPCSTGYELNALYLGAEGTLGIITELTVRLFPRPKVGGGGCTPVELVLTHGLNGI